jgi:hypothetical protein
MLVLPLQVLKSGELVTFFPALTVEQVKGLSGSEATELLALLHNGHPVNDAAIVMAKEKAAAALAAAAAGGVPWAKK